MDVEVQRKWIEKTIEDLKQMSDVDLFNLLAVAIQTMASRAFFTQLEATALHLVSDNVCRRIANREQEKQKQEIIKP